MSNEIRVVLIGRAKEVHDQMLLEVRADGKTKINSSKLINWIVADYFGLLFQKRKQQLCREHFNSRKCLLEALKIEDPGKRQIAIQEAVKSLSSVRRLGRRMPATAKPSSGDMAEET